MAISFFKKEKPETLPETKEPALFPEPSATEKLPTFEEQGLRPAQPVFPLPAPVSLAPPQIPLPESMPKPPPFRPESPKPLSEEIEEIAEAIIAERWQKLTKELDEIKKIQEEFSASLSGLTERLGILEKRMDTVIQQVLGKVEEYGKGISDVGVELKALQKMFNTLMPTFTENIKELQELVEKAKEKGFRKK
ncbi:MAG: hypothetical protein QXQ79_00335 [Candidatus Nanoarchaeia archaeon]